MRLEHYSTRYREQQSVQLQLPWFQQCSIQAKMQNFHANMATLDIQTCLLHLFRTISSCSSCSSCSSGSSYSSWGEIYVYTYCTCTFKLHTHTFQNFCIPCTHMHTHRPHPCTHPVGWTAQASALPIQGF